MRLLLVNLFMAWLMSGCAMHRTTWTTETTRFTCTDHVPHVEGSAEEEDNKCRAGCHATQATNARSHFELSSALDAIDRKRGGTECLPLDRGRKCEGMTAAQAGTLVRSPSCNYPCKVSNGTASRSLWMMTTHQLWRPPMPS